ncbi:transposase [Komagataeibacter europaeus]|uniref:Transposase n=2 Tax=Komagataeibacter europaeus TaxID=33995 RepID=A0A0M0EBD5_KOMEU|nr:transposase [Komagataeibacter europaeus]
MQPLPDMDPQRRMTRRCVDHIREQGLIRPYAHLAREIGLDEKTIRDICNEEIEALLARHKPVAPVALGIDELHLLGRKRTIFTDVGERRILDLIESMNRPQVDRWLSLLEDRKRIRIVTIDMWGPYREAVQALLPDAVIISDKWHVQSKANAALDVIRNRQRRGAKGKDRRNPWRARRLLHAHGRNLSPQRAFVLDGMLKNNELLSMAWHTKEAFYDIWGGANRPSRHEAETMFDRWKADIPDEVSEFRAVAKTIDGWREQVFAYFEHPYTNAYTEAANGLIKIANRAGRGYRFDAIRAKAISIEPRVPVNLFVCESCLGQYPLVLRHWLEPEPDPKRTRVWRVCATCFRLHTPRWFMPSANSTPKSG